MLYDGQAQMLKNKDVDGLMNLTTTNYVGIRPDGKQMTRAQEMREFRSQLNALREIRMVKYTLSKPALHGFAATVTATRRLVAVGNGPHHRRVGVDSTSTMRDVWVQTPAGWKLKRHQVLSIVGAVGGKRVVWTAPRVR
jgi:ketosteroid isomerase-like protein